MTETIAAYGYRAAQLDPLGSRPAGDPELLAETHGLSEADLAALPAGIIGGPASHGAANALEVITGLARRMVREWGMSDRIGPMAWHSEQHVFLGEDLMTGSRDFSDDTARLVDEEVQRILRAEEQRLAELVQRLGELMAGFPVDTDEPFAASRGKLAWPVQGRVTGSFGQVLGAGPVRWNGVLLEAAAGTPVRAVHRGRIAFADWLQGLGLLIIVDHGGGYMSLYGHNEALLKESGDWVEPGEPIAQVGDTGGQARSGLYFEIRQNGEPVDPNRWIARPAAR